MSCISAADKIRYMTACKAVRHYLGVLLIIPGSAVCQPQVKAAVACLVITGGSSLVNAATIPSTVCTLQCQINSRRSRRCLIFPIIIALCRLGVDIAINLDNTCTCLAVLHVNVDNAIIIRLQRNVISCLAILFNIQAAIHIYSSTATAINTITFILRRGRNCSIRINGNLAASCINTLTIEASGISAELQALSLDGNILALAIAEAGCYCACYITAFSNMVGYIQIQTISIYSNRTTAGFNSTQIRAIISFGYINNCIIGEGVNALFFFNTSLSIFFICAASDWSIKGVFCDFIVLIIALSRCLRTSSFGREGNIAGLQLCTRSSQTA